MEGDFVKKECCGYTFGHSSMCANRQEDVITQNVTMEKKPFALLWLRTLRLAKFDTKQELTDATLTLQNNGTEFIALIYHKDADIYTVPEVI